jgi:lipopolysaccharide cholinephosphotransferase
LLTDESHGDFAYAIDNVFDAPKRKIIWDCNDILPVRKHPFDSFSFLVPAKAEKVADDCYPGWPYILMDICGHDHFAKDVLSDPDVRSAMARFVDECN